jgi:hypothetical protein
MIILWVARLKPNGGHEDFVKRPGFNQGFLFQWSILLAGPGLAPIAWEEEFIYDSYIHFLAR